MPPHNPLARFLLRGSMLMIVFLLVWWFGLLNPLLFLLRSSTELFGNLISVSETPSGDWSFTIPVEVVVANSPQSSGPAKIHSVAFDVPRADVITFTFSLPVFW